MELNKRNKKHEKAETRAASLVKTILLKSIYFKKKLLSFHRGKDTTQNELLTEVLVEMFIRWPLEKWFLFYLLAPIKYEIKANCKEGSPNNYCHCYASNCSTWKSWRMTSFSKRWYYHNNCPTLRLNLLSWVYRIRAESKRANLLTCKTKPDRIMLIVE